MKLKWNKTHSYKKDTMTIIEYFQLSYVVAALGLGLFFFWDHIRELD